MSASNGAYLSASGYRYAILDPPLRQCPAEQQSARSCQTQLIRGAATVARAAQQHHTSNRSAWCTSQETEYHQAAETMPDEMGLRRSMGSDETLQTPYILIERQRNRGVREQHNIEAARAQSASKQREDHAAHPQSMHQHNQLALTAGARGTHSHRLLR